MSESTRADHVRQAVVALTTAAAIVLAFLGSGALGGTPIQDAADGSFAADGTVVAPAGAAFSIWSVIYVGLAGYAIWQAFPGQAAKAMHRSIGYGVAASSLLNAVWIACTQAGRIIESLVIIALLLIVLLMTFARVCRRTRQGTIAEIILADGTVGLYLGWVTLAAGANTAAVAVSMDLPGWDSAPGWPGVIVLVVAGLVALATAWVGGRWAPAIGTAWGASWIAIARFTDEPHAPIVGSVALALAVVLIAVTLWRFLARVRGRRVAEEAAIV